jgi:hypothetical protein
MRRVKGLIYLCKNSTCINYYLKPDAKKIEISFYDYDPNKLPICFYCFKKMASELERSVQYLKVELELPSKSIKKKAGL